jgi:CheY-like chemotaxis protein
VSSASGSVSKPKDAGKAGAYASAFLFYSRFSGRVTVGKWMALNSSVQVLSSTGFPRYRGLVFDHSNKAFRGAPLANILCVDDSELGLFVRQMVLQSCGHTVVTATSAEQALSLFQLAHFDVVVADYFLGNETGEELVQLLKQSRPDIGVLMLSGAPDVESTAADAFLLKGGDPRSLIDAVKELLDRDSRRAMARAVGY